MKLLPPFNALLYNFLESAQGMNLMNVDIREDGIVVS